MYHWTYKKLINITHPPSPPSPSQHLCLSLISSQKTSGCSLVCTWMLFCHYYPSHSSRSVNSASATCLTSTWSLQQHDNPQSLCLTLSLRSYFDSQKSYSSDFTLSHHSSSAPGNFQTQGLFSGFRVFFSSEIWPSSYRQLLLHLRRWRSLLLNCNGSFGPTRSRRTIHMCFSAKAFTVHQYLLRMFEINKHDLRVVYSIIWMIAVQNPSQVARTSNRIIVIKKSSYPGTLEHGPVLPREE